VTDPYGRILGFLHRNIYIYTHTHTHTHETVVHKVQRLTL
jgi:hypothetical protein